MNDLAKQIFADATTLLRAQAELARNIDTAPRSVWLLWNGYALWETRVVLLGVFLSEARAKRELEQYLSHNPEEDLWVEQRVAHS